MNLRELGRRMAEATIDSLQGYVTSLDNEPEDNAAEAAMAYREKERQRLLRDSATERRHRGRIRAPMPDPDPDAVTREFRVTGGGEAEAVEAWTVEAISRRARRWAAELRELADRMDAIADLWQGHKR